VKLKTETKARLNRETSLGGYVPRIETFRKDNDYVVRLDLPGFEPRTFRSMRKEMFYRLPGNEKLRRTARTLEVFHMAGLSGR
jgi:hypothetical protein